MVKTVKENKGLPDLREQLNKNLYKYLFSLSNLQAAFPFLFKDVLANEIQLIEYIIDNPDYFETEYTLRAAVICLNSILRRYSNQSQRLGNYEEIKKQCVNDFYQYFTAEKIENFFNIFLVKLLPRRPSLTNDQDADNLDEFVEIGTSIY